MLDPPARRVSNRRIIELDEASAAHNYDPLPIAAATAEGSWITDVEGHRYLDFLSAYSALNFGHRHPRLVAAAQDQLARLTLTSRAIHNDQMGAFSRDLAALCRMEAALLMNSGAEAVETAVKLARKWGYLVKGIPSGLANIVVAEGNFHGRTISIVSFSDDPAARDDYGPYTPGFRSVPFGDAPALAAAIDQHTAAVLLEPIQGEAGVIIPPEGYLREVRRLCDERDVLLVADEIQSGLGRTGETFACDHENVRPDVFVLGKALGGGIVPLSAVVSSWDVLKVIRPGEHGSTFGGNPLAAAIGREVVAMLSPGEIQDKARSLGRHFADALTSMATAHDTVASVRVRGLWAGMDLRGVGGREFSKRLLGHGVLAKDTHGQTIRFAPPLTIDEADLEWGLERIDRALTELAREHATDRVGAPTA